MDYQVLHVGISVPNMEESLAWYQTVLGFELVKDDYVPPLGTRICFIQNGDFQLELFQYDDPKPLPNDRRMPNTDLQTVGTKHVAFGVSDLNTWKEAFLEKGVDIAHEAQMDGDHVLFIRDNSGILLEFIEEKA